MPSLDVSELNVVLGFLGAYISLYGLISVKLKSRWYLGEALIIGIAFGPVAARFIDSERWGTAEPGQTSAITLGVMRVMIGLQLVIAGFQLPARYQLTRWKEMAILLVPVMTMMWICTSLCMFATVPRTNFLLALVMGACVTPTDPILSQAIAKGPFADKYVPRPLREIISSEAGGNDGFALSFLMLAVFIMRHGTGAPSSHDEVGHEVVHALVERAGDVGRLGGGVGVTIGKWFLETWLYAVIMSIVYGAVVGYALDKALKFTLRRKWVDDESYVLIPTALGLFMVGTCGLIGTNDLLASFAAGSALNWDGDFLEETVNRHDEVNSCVDVLLNFGGFIYLGTIIPWSEFHQPDVTGITWWRLLCLGIMVILLRRIPALLLAYKFMPQVCKNIHEALFMGYFGPIGVGAVFYVEHTLHLFPHLGEGDDDETHLVRCLRPVIYFLVIFSIFVHGISIPLLNVIYTYMGIEPIQEDAVEKRRKSMHVAMPANAVEGDGDTYIAYNRFFRPSTTASDGLPMFDPDYSICVREERKKQAQADANGKREEEP